MATDSYNNSKTNKYNGWYYDLQLNDKLSSVTLHANRKPGGDDWEDYDEDKRDDDGYGVEPLCRAILNEDFSVTAANNWSEFGGDVIGELYGNLQLLAPYSDHLEKNLKTMSEKSKVYSADTLGGKIANGVVNAVNKVKDFMGENNITGYLNKALIVQGTRFAYYAGTGIAFSNLGMKFTVFPTWKVVNGENIFLSVTEQLEYLYPYFIGKYKTADIIKEDFIKNFIAFQSPPGGFKANLQNIDTVQEGTLKLKFGPYYAITNLVCADATFNFSKQMVKQPSEGKIKISPLYCDVNLTLRPATKYSDESLKKFVSGETMKSEIEETEDLIDANVMAAKESLE